MTVTLAGRRYEYTQPPPWKRDRLVLELNERIAAYEAEKRRWRAKLRLRSVYDYALIQWLYKPDRRRILENAKADELVKAINTIWGFNES